ncbi:MAG: hypothetical protein ACI8PB_004354 [Desulforhopalus sp.]
MTNLLPIVDNLCTNPANHKTHLCELKSLKKVDQVEKLSVNPEYICGNCAGLSNIEGALCAPGPFHD